MHNMARVNVLKLVEGFDWHLMYEGKFEARNPKSETNSKFKSQMFKTKIVE